MNNQYCKIGTVKPITSGSSALAALEHRYQRFVEMAAQASDIDAQLREFFEAKASQFKKILESLG
ncbi:MAG: hypothetical protein AAGF77_09230 [Bacteroidota bacterium]